VTDDEPMDDAGASPLNPDAADHEQTDAGMTGEARDKLEQAKADQAAALDDQETGAPEPTDDEGTDPLPPDPEDLPDAG
jgi:hypothetical protein